MRHSRFIVRRVAQIRKTMGLTQKDVAALAGLPESSYRCIESGARGLTLDRLALILPALGADITDVWPWDVSQSRLDQMNALRLREIARSSKCTAALVGARRGSRWEVWSRVNVTEEESRLLRSPGAVKAAPPLWRSWHVGEAGTVMSIWLKNAQPDQLSLSMIDCYLKLWLAMCLYDE